MLKRRPRKSMQQWRDVIADQQASGLSRADYCVQHDIHIDTFSARLSDINRQHDSTGNQATDSVDAPQLVKVARSVNATENKLTIHHDDVVLRVPLPVEPEWVVAVLRGLQA